MFKRLILILVLCLSLSGADHANAATAADYRAYANHYLKAAATYALEAYKSANNSGSSSPYLAYFYSLYAKYSSEIGTWLAQYGNATIADLYNNYVYLYSWYALNHAYQTYLDSSAANSANAYYSYLYTYLGNLYSYYATIIK